MLNGSKIFSSGASVADYLVLTARTGPPDSRHLGLTVFLVDARSPGLVISGIPKLGHHAVPDGVVVGVAVDGDDGRPLGVTVRGDGERQPVRGGDAAVS